MAKTIMKLNGIDGQVTLLSDRVVITREGLMNLFAHGFNSKREIPLSAISEVIFKDATLFKQGYIEFVRSGRATHERESARQSTVRFQRKQAVKFEEMKEKIFEMMEQNNRQRPQ